MNMPGLFFGLPAAVPKMVDSGFLGGTIGKIYGLIKEAF